MLNINLIRQSFYNPVCLKCGSFFIENHLFCQYCFVKFMQGRIDFTCSENHYYLIDWPAYESDTLSRLVYHLKSNHCSLALHFYTELLSSYLKTIDKVRICDYIIPLPGSQASSIHSHIIAKHISDLLKIPYLDVLVKEIPLFDSELNLERAQKNRNKLQRENLTNIKYQKNVDPKTIDLLKKKKILYVDDILTTGNTVNAAFKLLEQDGLPLVTTLFFRTIN